VTSQTTIVRNTKLQSRDRVDQRFPSSLLFASLEDFEENRVVAAAIAGW
jgi:hypothetical protein